MDLLELLIPILFIGIPLLGRLLQGRTQPPEGTLPPVPMESDAGHREEPARLPAPAKAESGGGWAAGWGEWPGMETEEETADVEGIAGDHDLAADSIHTAEAMSLEPVARQEVVVRPLPAPVPAALDATEVDRRGEHQRFHRKYFEPAPPRPRSDRLADHLKSRKEVRRAVVLAEVLGPPRSLREIDSDR